MPHIPAFCCKATLYRISLQDYLTGLEQNMVGLTSHLEQSARRGHGSPMERAAHWFRAISDSEPHHTYLKRAAADLARTCEGMEAQLGDSDEMLFIQNLQSLTDYVRVAQVCVCACMLAPCRCVM